MVLEGLRASYGYKPGPPEERAAGRVGWGPWGALTAGQRCSPLTGSLVTLTPVWQFSK